MSKNEIEPKLRIKEHKITNAYNFTYMIVLEKIKLRIWWGLTLIFRDMEVNNNRNNKQITQTN